MYSLLWFCVLAMAWSRSCLRQGGGIILYACYGLRASAAGFLTHYFFLFPWVAMVALSPHAAWEAFAKTLGDHAFF